LGDRQVQEADSPQLCPDDFQSLLDSSDVDLYSASSEGLEADLDPVGLFLIVPSFFFFPVLARFVDDFPP
jgi:hypothetical protein